MISFCGLYTTRILSPPVINADVLKVMIAEENRKKIEIEKKIKNIELQFNRSLKVLPKQTKADLNVSMPASLAIILGDTCKSFKNTGTAEMIAFVIEQTIQKQFPRITIVDRMTFDDILDELTISLSKLVHPKDRIVPEIMPAHILLTINIGIVENEPYLYFRLKHSQSGLQIKTIEYKIQDKIPIRQQINNISSRLIQCLKKKYDIKGTIVSVYSHQINVNIGNNIGIQMHQPCNVIGQNSLLRVISVKANSCGLCVDFS
ncbi:hypothetical protein MHK_000077 [Candidatus Magnetomorum sp. HK-1]|nr:hypothetical protein MHK_000077 [Candidatus Magnetomorum sp. HK-1]